MFFVALLAMAGLFLIFLEFFLPGAIMAVGGSLLLFASLYVFYRVEANPTWFILYFVALIGAVYTVIRLALWKVKAKIVSKEEP